MSHEKQYRLLHENRIRLRCAGMLSDSQNESIKEKIEKWGRKNKVSTVTEHLETLKKANKIMSRKPKQLST